MMLRCRAVRKYVIFGLVSVATLLIIYMCVPAHVDWNYTATFDYECQPNGSKPYPHIFHYCIQGPKIFFIETSGSRALSVRQACAVESTAKKNPSMSVLVLMTPENGIDKSNPLMKSLMQLQNVKVKAIDIDVFVYGSPIWSWYRTGNWRKSKWKVSHLSDAVRFFVVWKYGGVYLDLDVVMLQSIEHLKNSVVTENWERVAAGILIFDRGHEFMNRVMVDFAAHYDPYNFVANGPGVVVRNLREYCDITDVSKISGTDCNVTVLPPEAAFPINWENWGEYFEQHKEINNVSSYYNSSYMLHVWNKASAFRKIKIGSDCLYERAIKENCPLSYEHAKTVNTI